MSVQELFSNAERISSSPRRGEDRGEGDTVMHAAALTPSLSQWEREITQLLRKMRYHLLRDLFHHIPLLIDGVRNRSKGFHPCFLETF